MEGKNHAKEEKDITNKELLREIHKDIQMHSERLGKIEDAIITLAATQERVRVLDESLRHHMTTNLSFQSDVWAEFKEMNQNHSKCLEARVLLFERTADANKELDKLNTWKDDVNIKVIANSKTRNLIEKVAIGAIVGVITAIAISIWGMRGPSAKFDALEASLGKHLTASTEIAEMLKNEHLAIEELKKIIITHDKGE